MSTENKKQDFVWTDELVLDFASNARYFTKNSLNNFKDLYREKRSPEYEILSFDGSKFSEEQVRAAAKFGEYDPNGIYVAYALQHNFPIHSVRRLSDGEVFTLGDELVLENGEKHKIVGFDANEQWVGGIRMLIEETYGFSRGVTLYYATKLPTPKPLFTTEDGVEVHSGENCWVVRPQVQGGYKLIRWHEVCESGMQYGERYFSQQKAAQEWIEAQTPKPLFRTEDGVDIYEGDECYICKKSATPNKWNIHKWFKACKEGIDTEGEKYFNSLKAAEEWMAAQKPPVLFTTEDGVDLFSISDTVYGVCPKGTWETRELGLLLEPNKTNWKWFAIPYNRDRYILLNKPLLSINEVINAYDTNSEEPDQFLEALNQLAKEKL